jgi:periplasmic protein TonB
MGIALDLKYGRVDREREIPRQEWPLASIMEDNGLASRDDGSPPSVQMLATTPSATMDRDSPMSETDSQAAAVSAASGIELNVAFGIAVEEQPIWVGLYQSIRDVFFPPHLPPLELTSTPIPIPDRMAVKPNPWAYGVATALNLAVLAILIFLGVKTIIKVVNAPKLDVTTVDVPPPFKAPKLDNPAGGGGGSPDKVEAIKGRIPPRMQPVVITEKIENPVPSIDVQKDIVIPDNPNLPNFGMSNSANVKLGSLGNGSGMGVGNGHGNGYGDGTGGNIGGGLYRVGGGVSAPVPLNNVEAEFSDEARRAKYQGVCLISLIVDTNGNPQNPRVVQALGMGLDEKALEAVRKYKFKPAMKDNKTPVPVMITVLVNFRLY